MEVHTPFRFSYFPAAPARQQPEISASSAKNVSEKLGGRAGNSKHRDISSKKIKAMDSRIQLLLTPEHEHLLTREESGLIFICLARLVEFLTSDPAKDSPLQKIRPAELGEAFGRETSDRLDLRDRKSRWWPQQEGFRGGWVFYDCATLLRLVDGETGKLTQDEAVVVVAEQVTSRGVFFAKRVSDGVVLWEASEEAKLSRRNDLAKRLQNLAAEPRTVTRGTPSPNFREQCVPTIEFDGHPMILNHSPSFDEPPEGILVAAYQQPMASRVTLPAPRFNPSDDEEFRTINQPDDCPLDSAWEVQSRHADGTRYQVAEFDTTNGFDNGLTRSRLELKSLDIGSSLTLLRKTASDYGPRNQGVWKSEQHPPNCRTHRWNLVSAAAVGELLPTLLGVRYTCTPEGDQVELWVSSDTGDIIDSLQQVLGDDDIKKRFKFERGADISSTPACKRNTSPKYPRRSYKFVANRAPHYSHSSAWW